MEERIKEIREYFDKFDEITYDNLEWLIEQAQKLEKIQSIINGEDKIRDMDYVFSLYGYLKEKGLI